MYKILEKKPVTENTDSMVIEAPEIARKAQPGQFIIIREDEFSERIPLTIADFDREAGTITVIFQKVGKSTAKLGELQAGDSVRNFVGPLGQASEIKNYGSVALVAGGVGAAPVYPIARALKAAGNRVTVIMGARNISLLFWVEKMRSVCDELILCTDDGSAGMKGLVTEPLRELVRSAAVARVWAIGPAIMMKFCCATCAEFSAPIVVSLDSIMVDGTGMCGACRVMIGGEMKFVCVDGPEFDGSKVKWDEVLARKKVFVSEEQKSYAIWQSEQSTRHICNLDKALVGQETAVVRSRVEADTVAVKEAA